MRTIILCLSPHRLLGSDRGLLVERSICGTPLLSAMADVISGPVLDDMVSEVDMGRVALTGHFSLDVLCMEMHQPHVFLPQVLCADSFSWWSRSWSLGY